MIFSKLVIWNLKTEKPPLAPPLGNEGELVEKLR
jgi:hypothetical protein